MGTNGRVSEGGSSECCSSHGCKCDGWTRWIPHRKGRLSSSVLRICLVAAPLTSQRRQLSWGGLLNPEQKNKKVRMIQLLHACHLSVRATPCPCGKHSWHGAPIEHPERNVRGSEVELWIRECRGVSQLGNDVYDEAWVPRATKWGRPLSRAAPLT